MNTAETDFATGGTDEQDGSWAKREPYHQHLCYLCNLWLSP